MEQQLDQRRTAHRDSLDTRHQLSPWAATHRELRAMARRRLTDMLAMDGRHARAALARR